MKTMELMLTRKVPNWDSSIIIFQDLDFDTLRSCDGIPNNIHNKDNSSNFRNCKIFLLLWILKSLNLFLGHILFDSK